MKGYGNKFNDDDIKILLILSSTYKNTLLDYIKYDIIELFFEQTEHCVKINHINTFCCLI